MFSKINPFIASIAISLILTANLNAADTKDKTDNKGKKEITFDIKPEEMLAKLRTTAINDIKPEELEWSRKLYPNRYRPLSMDFEDKDVQKYLQSIPQELQAGEKTRIEKIKDVKPLIVRIIERNPYEPKSGGIKIRSGTSVTSVPGMISLANEAILIVKKGKNVKNSKRYKWEELAFEQYENFLTYYAGQRLLKAGGNVSKDESRKYAGEDYFRLAILCDWFGEYEKCMANLKKAIDLNPDLKNSAGPILFD
ncbi:MAG: hypothetical protein WAX69_19350 [Victivallales bacterium]